MDCILLKSINQVSSYVKDLNLVIFMALKGHCTYKLLPCFVAFFIRVIKSIGISKNSIPFNFWKLGNYRHKVCYKGQEENMRKWCQSWALIETLGWNCVFGIDIWIT